ncbi:MAG TPA: hypothetical protein VG818_08950, partial [Gemmatimonadaceae bacterium]|nr:hypothetical protein [Gemmatimonadaceae bacterium]
MRSPGARWWQLAILAALGCAAATRLSIATIVPSTHAPVVSFEAGLMLAWLLRTPTSRWPQVLVLAAIAEFAAWWAVATPAIAFGLGAAAVAQAAIGAFIIERIRRPPVVLSSFASLVTVLLVPAAIAIPAVALRSTLVLGTPPGERATVWLGFYVAGVVGTAAVAPLWLSLSPMPAWLRGRGRAVQVEAAAIAALVLGVSWLTLARPPAEIEPLRPAVTLTTLLFLWAALRFGLVGAAWSVFAYATLGAWETVRGLG